MRQTHPSTIFAPSIANLRHYPYIPDTALNKSVWIAYQAIKALSNVASHILKVIMNPFMTLASVVYMVRCIDITRARHHDQVYPRVFPARQAEYHILQKNINQLHDLAKTFHASALWQEIYDGFCAWSINTCSEQAAQDMREKLFQLSQHMSTHAKPMDKKTTNTLQMLICKINSNILAIASLDNAVKCALSIPAIERSEKSWDNELQQHDNHIVSLAAWLKDQTIDSDLYELNTTMFCISEEQGFFDIAYANKSAAFLTKEAIRLDWLSHLLRYLLLIAERPGLYNIPSVIQKAKNIQGALMYTYKIREYHNIEARIIEKDAKLLSQALLYSKQFLLDAADQNRDFLPSRSQQIALTSFLLEMAKTNGNNVYSSFQKDIELFISKRIFPFYDHSTSLVPRHLQEAPGITLSRNRELIKHFSLAFKNLDMPISDEAYDSFFQARQFVTSLLDQPLQRPRPQGLALRSYYPRSPDDIWHP